MDILRKTAPALFTLLIVLLCGPALACGVQGGEQEKADAALEEKWGIRIEGMRLTAGGYMTDFRFRVLEPEKARPLLERAVKPSLTDEATGARFMVPAPSKVGMLRQASNYGKIKKDNTYFIIFANPGRFIKPGAKVTVEIGEFKAQGLAIE